MLRLLGGHFTLFPLLRVPLILSGQAQALENDLVILARFRRVRLLMLNKCVRKIEF